LPETKLTEVVKRTLMGLRDPAGGEAHEEACYGECSLPGSRVVVTLADRDKPCPYG
jgi:hypothetical protein